MAEANENTTLDITAAGEKLTPAQLAHAIDALKAQAKALNALKIGKSESELQDIETEQAALRAMAMKLNAAAIDLLAEEPRVSAEHINAAIAYANEVMKSVETLKKTLTGVGLLLEFLAVVLTGSGTQIVKAAVRLKRGLDDLMPA